MWGGRWIWVAAQSFGQSKRNQDEEFLKITSTWRFFSGESGGLFRLIAIIQTTLRRVTVNDCAKPLSMDVFSHG